MCVEPTTALMIASATSQVMNYQQQKAQAKFRYTAQKRTNEIARANAIQRYASEQLKIRQVLKASREKDYLATLKSRRARARFISEAGDAGGLALSGSTQALLANFYRIEGNYKTALQRNMNVNISQFERNLEAIQFGQQAQSVYEQPPNPALLFASGALNVANTYYGIQYQKELMGYKSNAQKKRDIENFNRNYGVQTYSI